MAEPSAASADSTSAPTPIDGRRARRTRNREAVIDAARELFREGNGIPSLDEIADRAGLSVRSMYRYFADSEALLTAAVQASVSDGERFSRIERFGRGTFEERLEAFVVSRMRLYEWFAPGFRAAQLHASRVPQVSDGLAMGQGFLRSQVEGQFAVELDAMPDDLRSACAAACDSICQLESIEHMRVRRGCTPEEAGDALRVALVALLRR